MISIASNAIIKLINESQIDLCDDGRLILSKTELFSFLLKLNGVKVYSELDKLPDECFVLVYKNFQDFYPFLIDEIHEWAKDGSFGNGDKLYKTTIMKNN
ncbi:MAG: hypothetical protein V4506_16210 [Bacteroidota bacterium]